MKIQPSFLFDLLNVKNEEEAERILTGVLSLLVYIKEGDRLETTSGIEIEKIDKNLLYIHNTVDPSEIVDTLESFKIIKLLV